MKKLIVWGLFGILCCGISACSTGTKEKLGMTKKAPNEFMVMPRAPLSLPPEYDLRPVAEPQVDDSSNMGLSEAEQNLVAKLDDEK